MQNMRLRLNEESYTGPLKELARCTFCPRACGADRLRGKAGYCNSGAGFSIASICIHRGEEPAVSGPEGICNIFFTNCNLQCLYCQNHQISSNRLDHGSSDLSLTEVVGRIADLLDQGIRRVGFVSPSHFIPQVEVIIRTIRAQGFDPVWVYNSNGYDSVQSLRRLEGMIDVYLPDLKYLDADLAGKWSGAADYPVHAMAALREMYRQKGSPLHLADDGTAESGIIVRHLVLPGGVQNSLDVVRFLALELSPKIHVSLMSQYYPTGQVASLKELNRAITRSEYLTIVHELDRLGMHNGWIQEFESSEFYRPDFDLPHPFEKS